MKKRQIQKAFTLAEVLITLAIIGIVAALTIPTLISNYQEKQTVTKLIKSFSVINNAYALAKIEYGDITSWGFSGNSQVGTSEDGKHTQSEVTVKNSKIFLDIMSKYLKVSQRVNQLDLKDQTGYFLNGNPTSTETFTNGTDILLLQDGTSIQGGWISNYRCTSGICGDFSIDINGPDNPPNAYGRDRFSFHIYKNAIIPMGKQDDLTRPFETSCNMESNVDHNGYGCTAWVIYNKNMDYLHCNDLSWEDKHSCKE